MKSIFSSKTLWVNVLTVVAGGLVFVIEHDVITDNPDLVAALAGVLGLVNIGLRFITTQPVAITVPK